MVGIKLIDDYSEVNDLLSYCIYQPNETKVEKIIKDYLKNDKDILFGYFNNRDEIIGCIGIRVQGKKIGTILHISVDSNWRKSGIAKDMINQCIQRLNLKYIEAETDADAVIFYEKCGFTTVPLGEKYPGVTRYLCIKK